MKHLGTKQINTPRLLLRRFTIEDAPKMYGDWASDEEVTRYLLWAAHKSQEETESLLKSWAEDYKNAAAYLWCIEWKETAEPIGSIGVTKMIEQAQLVELGYFISRRYWHQGIATEALQAVMDFFFDEVGVNRVESRHDPRNPYSGKVMEACGMRYEGTRIEADFNNSGICDEVLYGLTRKQRTEAQVRKSGKYVQSAHQNTISDEMIDYVGILAKLELSPEEKERAKKDMGEMLDYIDKLNELDTTGIEPMSHIFPMTNVFREDVVTNGDDSENMLQNAPEVKNGSYVVPKTVE